MTIDERAVWEWTVRPTTEVEQLMYLLLRWCLDPIMFCIEALRIVPTLYQAGILLDLADAPAEVYAFYGIDPSKPKRQVLVPSGHGLGKTRVIAVTVWWMLLTHRFSTTLVTAPTAEQLTGRVWGELRKLYRRLKKAWPMIASDWIILGTSVQHTNEEFGDWQAVARTARVERPEGLQGAHALDVDDEFGELGKLFGEDVDTAPSGGMLVIAEEASGIPDEIRKTLEGALSEEGARFLAPGNPTRADGWFADDLDRTDRYAVHCLDCRQSDRSKTYAIPYRDFGGKIHMLHIRGFVRPAYWEEILRECDGDEDADYFRVRVRGIKPRSSSDQCIRTHWIDHAMAREPHAESYAEPTVVSLDFGLASDKHALAVRQGFNLRDAQEWLPRDKPTEVTMEAADRAIDAQQLYKAKYIIGDANGVGRGAMEYLMRYYREKPELNVTVIFFNAGEKAIDGKRFARRRDEMWFKYGRQWLADPRCHLPNIAGLKTQFTAPSYTEDTRRIIKVESKEDIKKRTGQPSGNLADAILQSLLVRIVAEKPKGEEEKPAHPPIFQQHFARYLARQNEGADIC